MLTLSELERVTRVLGERLAGARVERVVQPDARRVVLTLQRRGAGDLHLLACAEPTSARLSLVESRPAAPPAPPPFAQLLRARLGGSRLAGARIVDGDRQAALRFEGPEGVHELLLAILGPRSNAYLLDAEGRVAGSLRPLGETRRDLAVGEPWRSPASAPPPAGEDRFAAVQDAALFAALESAASEREERGHDAAQRGRLERALRRAAQALDRKLEALRQDAASAAEADTLRRQGELLKGVVTSLRPGDREARARDFASGEEVVIPLDVTLAPRDNLDLLFRRARKAEKRAARALRELGEVEARRAALAELARDWEAAAAGGAEGRAQRLAAFAERPEVARLLARFAPEAALATTAAPAPAAPRTRVWRIGKRELAARLAPRVYRSSDGLEIWVGRSDEGNDLLSTRLARGNDLFFHLDASPGSHVVLRTEGRPDPPSESMLEAAELAVHFSRHRKTTEAHVLVAPIKGVRKPRGAKPGLVTVSGGRALRLRRDPRRLERVLASREGGEALD